MEEGTKEGVLQPGIFASRILTQQQISLTGEEEEIAELGEKAMARLERLTDLAGRRRRAFRILG